jgi:DNA-binding SARP family transcriptional activator
MLVRLLGPVDVVFNGELQPLHGLRRKAVLAALALRYGEVASVDWLIEVVWGTSAPLTARNALQRHVSYLRGVLGSKNAILAQPPGYLLDLSYRTDVRHAERLLRQALSHAFPAGLPDTHIDCHARRRSPDHVRKPPASVLSAARVAGPG